MLECAVLLLGASLAVGSGDVPPVRFEVDDTVQILAVAYRHHVAGKAMDSAAVNIEVDREYPGDVSESVLVELAAELGLPTARRSEVLWCDEALTLPRRCGLRGIRQLVLFSLYEIEGDRAEVLVGRLGEWRPERVNGESTTYELRRTAEGWRVEKALISAAT